MINELEQANRSIQLHRREAKSTFEDNLLATSPVANQTSEPAMDPQLIWILTNGGLISPRYRQIA
jgi:hypothetical protein